MLPLTIQGLNYCASSENDTDNNRSQAVNTSQWTLENVETWELDKCITLHLLLLSCHHLLTVKDTNKLAHHWYCRILLNCLGKAWVFRLWHHPCMGYISVFSWNQRKYTFYIRSAKETICQLTVSLRFLHPQGTPDTSEASSKGISVLSMD